MFVPYFCCLAVAYFSINQLPSLSPKHSNSETPVVVLFGFIVLSCLLKFCFNSWLLALFYSFVSLTILMIGAIFIAKDRSLRINLIALTVCFALLSTSLFFVCMERKIHEISSDEIGFVIHQNDQGKVQELLSGTHIVPLSDDVYILPISTTTFAWVQGEFRINNIFNCDLVVDINLTPSIARMLFNKYKTSEEDLRQIIKNNIAESINKLSSKFVFANIFKNKEIVLQSIRDVVIKELKSIGIDDFSIVALELRNRL